VHTTGPHPDMSVSAMMSGLKIKMAREREREREREEGGRRQSAKKRCKGC